MPLDHFSLTVPEQNLNGIVTFLTNSLQHLGITEHMRPVPTVVAMGDTTPFLWIVGIEPNDWDKKTHKGLLKTQHIAFTAETIDDVHQFHTAGLKAGGTCNGLPGFRPDSHPGYYAAFVRDPECDINFEVVCHKGGEWSNSVGEQ
ncbi:hypothetical protein EMPG_10104 [Blastomyces silverae]|uniref:VOC domain-containing protein n=1 Tax=Blastomyces silverae TaxID=2060906 RepID=A0A0H1BBA4_9EURO|nr:hypothetical protein EMPG_10104 [Blastomyces silverae]